jgi:hypothetical protein
MTTPPTKSVYGSERKKQIHFAASARVVPGGMLFQRQIQTPIDLLSLPRSVCFHHEWSHGELGRGSDKSYIYRGCVWSQAKLAYNTVAA